MKRVQVAALCLLASALVTVPALFAADVSDATTKALAEIMINVRHYASDVDKEKLKKIAADTAVPAHERAIATAILNLEHHAADADKAKLDAIIKDAAAPQSVKDLASVVASLNHKPSDADVAKLKAIAKYVLDCNSPGSGGVL